VRVGDLRADTDWSESVTGVDTVVHTAARVHMMHDTSADPLTEFRSVNVDGTLQLARQAAAHGVRRFVFISSIKVNGDRTLPEHPFRADDGPAPTDPYGLSKYEAEQGLRAVSATTGMQVVVIRPVLVYGPGVKANFQSMMRWVQRGIPLPLGAIENQRSLVAVGNLADLVCTCVRHPAAAGETFLVSDGDDMSTTLLLRRIASAMQVPSRLIAVPGPLLRASFRAVGKSAVARRLCDSLQVDIQKTRDLLQWTPPVTVAGALAETARWFLRSEPRPHRR
jgi:nucleoside-diphosphate-sugar epimerase